MEPQAPVPEAKAVGLRVASTFRGMCRDHDREFAPIDNEPFGASPLQCMLLAFRAIALERYRKAAHAASMLGAAETVGQSPEILGLANLDLLEGGILGSHSGLQDMTALKADADRALLERNPARLEYRVLTFEGAPVMAATGVFTPDFDLNGARLQDLEDVSSPCELATLSLLPSEHATHLLFAWPAGGSKPARFVDSLLDRPAERIPRLIPQVCLGYLENVYFSREWWSSQSAMRQRRLAKFARFFSSHPLPVVAHEFVDWRFSGVSSPAA
jgi:hypothetical protein